MKRKLLLTLSMLLLTAMLASCSLFKKDSEADQPNNDIPQNEGAENLLWNVGDSINILAELGADSDVINSIFDKVAASIKSAPALKALNSEVGERELLIGNTGRKISNTAYEKLDRLEATEKYDSRWVIYCEGKSIAIAYDSDDEDVALNYAAEYFLSYCVASNGIVAKNGVIAGNVFNLKDHYQAIDDAATEKKWLKLEETTSKELVDALKDLYGMYSDDMILWLADLYDPAIGGFYYSNSARDTIGYLPDADST